MQRNIRIDTRNKLSVMELQQQTERALNEIQDMLNGKVANYETKNPQSTLIRIDESTNYLYVYNTATNVWVEYHPA